MILEPLEEIIKRDVIFDHEIWDPIWRDVPPTANQEIHSLDELNNAKIYPNS